jgi:hypothetical protein
VGYVETNEEELFGQEDVGEVDKSVENCDTMPDSTAGVSPVVNHFNKGCKLHRSPGVTLRNPLSAQVFKRYISNSCHISLLNRLRKPKRPPST